MAFNPAIFGRIPPKTAVFGNTIFGRVGFASGIAVIPIEADGFVTVAAADINFQLMLPRGPGSSGLALITGGIATPLPNALPSSLSRRVPTRANFRFTEGTSYRVGFQIIDLVHNPVNLIGSTFLFNVYNRSAPRTSASPILTKAISSGIMVLDTLGGQILVSFLPTDSHDLLQGIYDWELQLIEVNGDVYTPGMGVIIVSPLRRIQQ